MAASTMSRPTSPPLHETIDADVRRALTEDIGGGDATADLLPADLRAAAVVITCESAILCGSPWFECCFQAIDPTAFIDWNVSEGARVSAGMAVCRVSGNARALVTGERTALNFLQTLSGTATIARAYVDAVSGTRATILDTRKTLPGLRLAQKYAVRIGGASNHRIGLFDAILIKENHIAAAGSITLAIQRARVLHPNLMVEVETENFAELREALAAGADRIMLDEFELDELARAVTEVDRRVPLEVSGGVDLDRVRAIAETGVDYISIGALTKHVRAIDLSMRVELVSE